MNQATHTTNQPVAYHAPTHERILILDFDSQYSQLIARSIRSMGVYCEVHPATVDPQIIATFAPKGIILSGGPQSVNQENALEAPSIVFSLGCPVLGICYGMQTMAKQLGGTIGPDTAEFGAATIYFDHRSLLFNGIAGDSSACNVWMSHNDSVVQLPQGFVASARTNRCPYAAIEDPTRHYYAIQFHAEVTNTQHGIEILKNFALTICKVKQTWQPNNIIEETITQVRQQVGNDHVILATSGGVDSSVVAALLHRAIGSQLHCVFVDTGLVRHNEQDAINTLKNKLGVQLTIIDASVQFLTALKGITDPEQKRKIIGHEFIKVFEQFTHALPKVKWLGQGTIYPDVIESAKHVAGNKTIKSHHNVGGLPETMKLGLIEPIKKLFKDEVRILGRSLGLPDELIDRHPFPGPGLGVRILGEIKQEYVDAVRKADAIFLDELRAHDLYHQTAQAFAVFLPIKSVGVKGDVRHYGYVISLRAVTSSDFMTADWAELPHAFLTKVSNRIVNEIPIISRVTYDISSKPPATIEWE